MMFPLISFVPWVMYSPFYYSVCSLFLNSRSSFAQWRWTRDAHWIRLFSLVFAWQRYPFLCYSRSPPAVATEMHRWKTVGLTFRAVCSLPDFGIRWRPFSWSFLPVSFLIFRFTIHIIKSSSFLEVLSWIFQLILKWFSESRDGISYVFR